MLMKLIVDVLSLSFFLEHVIGSNPGRAFCRQRLFQQIQSHTS